MKIMIASQARNDEFYETHQYQHVVTFFSQ